MGLVNQRKLRLIKAAEEGLFDDDRPIDISFFAAWAARTSMGPYRNPDRPGQEPLRAWVRRNGDCTLIVQPGMGERDGVPYSIGLAYGNLPRVLSMYVCDKAFKTGNPKVELGPSMASFLRKGLGMASTGGPRGTITLLRDQANRLFRSRISFHWDDPTGQRDVGGQIIMAKAWNLDFHGSLAAMESATPLWPAEIELSAEFFKHVIDHPVPLRYDVVRALQRSAPCLDLYAWLTWRMATLQKPVTVSWNALKFQFGYRFADTPQGWSQFRKDFATHLHQVLLVYPQAKAEVTKAGLKLSPSLTSVPFRGVRALQAGPGAGKTSE